MEDCKDCSVAAYTTPSQYTVFDREATIGGGRILLGFTHAVADFFAELDLLD